MASTAMLMRKLSIVDIAIYSKSQQFRMPFCSKLKGFDEQGNIIRGVHLKPVRPKLQNGQIVDFEELLITEAITTKHTINGCNMEMMKRKNENLG